MNISVAKNFPDFDSQLRCSGCGACASICPVSAINFKPDQDGFMYPEVNSDLCRSCGLCQKVCMINKQELSVRIPLKAYAGYAKDTRIIDQCTSGGIATAIALNVVKNGGVVFGVKYTNGFEACEYSKAQNEDEIYAFCGSKYIQSSKNLVHKEVEKELLTNRLVLFIGCPCDVAGLHYYLRKEYDNLLTIDFSCAGISTPIIASDYVKLEEKRKKQKMIQLTTRCKRYGWFVPQMEEIFENGKIVTKPFFSSEYGFASLTFKRSSCLNCNYKECRGFSDIKIGDFWGVKNEDPFWNPSGVSFILSFTDKGKEMIQTVENDGFCLYETSYDRIYANNDGLHAILNSSKLERREQFAKLYRKNGLLYACRKSEGLLVKLKRIIPSGMREIAKRGYHYIVDK